MRQRAPILFPAASAARRACGSHGTCRPEAGQANACRPSSRRLHGEAALARITPARKGKGKGKGKGLRTQRIEIRGDADEWPIGPGRRAAGGVERHAAWPREEPPRRHRQRRREVKRSPRRAPDGGGR